MKIARLIASGAVLAILAACGGGGGDSGSPNASEPGQPDEVIPTPTPVPDNGFVKSENMAYVLAGPNGGSYGGFDHTVPFVDGVYRDFYTIVFSDDTQVVQKFEAPAYAMGSFSNGSYTTYKDLTPVAIGADQRWYYVAYNRLESLPNTTAVFTCTGQFLESMNKGVKAHVTGQASLSLAAGVAAVNVQLSIAPENGTAPVDISATKSIPSSNVRYGQFLNNTIDKKFAGVALGKGVDNGYVIVTSWEMEESYLSWFKGAAVFDCR